MSCCDQVSQVSTLPSDSASGRGPHFVISIDYGTTYTGAAWWLRSGTGEVPSPDQFRVIDNWPGGIQPKVPSTITYSQSKGHTWGFKIGGGAYVIRWTKLDLEPPGRLDALQSLRRALGEAGQLGFKNKDILGGNTNLPRHLIKSPYNILVDYLKGIARCVRQDIVDQGREEDLDRFPIDFVITHPSIWDDRAKSLTFRAVNEAFEAAIPTDKRSTRPSYIRMVSEPDACAQYTVRTPGQGAENLRRGDCFVMVDAGGGTVDLTSYVVQQVTPGFRIRRTCGATIIDHYFLHRFLPEKLGEDGHRKLMEIGVRHGGGAHKAVLREGQLMVLQDFETIKHGFTGAGEGTSIVGNINLPDEVGNETNLLSITRDDMIEMFQETLDGIYDLIHKQIVQTDLRNRQTKTMFFSGGLSRNEYLYRQISDHMLEWNMNVVRGEDSWTAVARGAALIGLAVNCTPPPACVPCPFHLGVVISERFEEWNHQADQRYHDPRDGRGVTLAKENIKWLVDKGELLTGERDPSFIKIVPITGKFKENGVKQGRITVVTDGSSEDDPTRGDDEDSAPRTRHRPGRNQGDHFPLQYPPLRKMINHFLFVFLEIYLDYDLRDLSPETRTVALESNHRSWGTENTYQRVKMELEITLNQHQAVVQLVHGRTIDARGVVGAPGQALATRTIPFGPNNVATGGSTF
ncbi:hypothetical protein MKZ38_001347 [Zalerion maritima]|uniref:Uncharacterized protein n=1 Tax=Zalerion maritima TaxID=339359 RepID=A0AAD5RQB6_9PEZI|nr:hypothetical protein MKZ38_001347 [Zalerion maritima]